MNLSNNIISQFVKMTNDSSRNKDQTKTYGTIVKSGDITYVRLDGSDLMTPINTTVHVDEGDRVTVTVKNHNVIVDGNLSDISASNGAVSIMGEEVTSVVETVENINVDVSGVTDSIDAIRQQTNTMESMMRNIQTNTDNKFSDTDQINADLSARITNLENEVLTVSSYVYESVVEVKAVGTTVVSLPIDMPENSGTNYAVVLSIKSYSFIDAWDDIITQKCIVYTSTKTDKNFSIVSDITALNVNDFSKATNGTAVIKYTIITLAIN